MFFNKNKNCNYLDVTIKNFLSYLLDNVDELTKREDLFEGYTNRDRQKFIYCCAIFTIGEYVDTYTFIDDVSISSDEIIQLFKTNFEMRSFNYEEIPKPISPKTEKLISQFEWLQAPLQEYEKTSIMFNANKIITSAK